ncbi:hypothetical protein [Palleronia sp. LCG004]|uniref:hypothetical protein n=1 Tax=Palleronia sp. LCG004 TaxID=3079304 RepID=UPI0029432B15|nr:hypothetical protein [Palleronia sp. LCG004]WOI54947.1 hypothetical protein RVY76_07670 [Palleronia sp. LCG004]
MLEWAETNPELAIACLTVIVAPLIAGLARKLFPHSESRPAPREVVSSKMREALADTSATVRLSHHEQRAIALDVKRILLVLEEMKDRTE